MQTEEELDLIKRAQQGDHLAFRRLVEAYQRFVYSIAYRFMCQGPEAEDATQEVFIKLWKNLNKYRPEVKLTTWLYQIVSNQCLDYLKSAERKRQLKNVEMKPTLPIIDHASGETQTDQLEMLNVITTLAAKLTPKQQAVFILRDLEGLTVEEVCETLSLSAENLKSNLYYARLKIREDLQLYYQESTKLNKS